MGRPFYRGKNSLISAEAKILVFFVSKIIPIFSLQADQDILIAIGRLHIACSGAWYVLYIQSTSGWKEFN